MSEPKAATSFFRNPLPVFENKPALDDKYYFKKVGAVEIDDTSFSIVNDEMKRRLFHFDKNSDCVLNSEDGFSDSALAGFLVDHMRLLSDKSLTSNFFIDMAKINKMGRGALELLRTLAEGANVNKDSEAGSEFEYDSCGLLDEKIEYAKSIDLPNRLGNYFVELGRFKKMYFTDSGLNGSTGIEEVVSELKIVNKGILDLIGTRGSLQLECDVPMFSLDFCCFSGTFDLGHYMFDNINPVDIK